jgi:hypothetical protein
MDPTINSFTLRTRDQHERFDRLFALGRGESLKIDPSARKFFLSVAKELENLELYTSVVNSLDGPPDVSSVLYRLNSREEAGITPDSEIAFLASHFHELSVDLLSELTVSQLHDVLHHPSLQIRDEEMLCSYLISRFESDPLYFEMIEFIHFEYLSDAVLSEFVAHSHKFLSLMNLSIWNRICDRLISTASTAIQSGENAISCPFRPDHALNGIIRHLTLECGGNVHDAGVVTVSESSVQTTNTGKNAADLSTGRFYCSRDSENQWVCYDFQNMRIKPTYYSFRSYFGMAGFNLRSWVVEGSMDNEYWTELHTQTDPDGIAPGNTIRVFAIEKPVMCRYIRLRQTGRNENGNSVLCISAFEVFGLLFK